MCYRKGGTTPRPSLALKRPALCLLNPYIVATQIGSEDGWFGHDLWGMAKQHTEVILIFVGVSCSYI